MRTLNFIFISILLFASACSPLSRSDTADLPPGFSLDPDVDVAALQAASLAFGNDKTHPSTPQGWARSFANVDYIAGAYNTHARWIGKPAFGSVELLFARNKARAWLGISPMTRSQAVVDRLAKASEEFDLAHMLEILDDPIFTYGSNKTLERLTNVPTLPEVRLALQYANQAFSSGSVKE